MGRDLTYAVPECFSERIVIGSWVIVSLRGRRYLSVVESIGPLRGDMNPSAVMDIEDVLSMPPVSASEIKFWHLLADYYLCSPGEVFKSAYPASFQKQVEKKVARRRKSGGSVTITSASLNEAQSAALSAIEKSFSNNKNVLLQGVTGSGKTEIYIKLAEQFLAAGGNVLYLVPEIALSRQLEERLTAVFGPRLKVWHSKQTPATRKAVFDMIRGHQPESDAGPYILLGTRSSVLLPLSNLRLVIVDEEHDSSYKQDDPAPRYNGRDVALMIASRCGANVILGSATPSLESLYNAFEGKLDLVRLTEKYYRAPEAEITVIDMRKAVRLHDVKGSFSMKLINMIATELDEGRQVMIFRSRRAYSSYIQCSACGDIPVCPKCNVSLTYHKFGNSLNCHYCGYRRRFDTSCSACGSGVMEMHGVGTEKLEEELKEYFPHTRVLRLDSDVAASKRVEREVLNDFALGKADILVGTQMISKGFDFPDLGLVAVINADSMLSLQDFRADERSVQLLRQLAGRSGRRGVAGRFVIQTYQPDHDVFKMLKSDYVGDVIHASLEERRQFGFPPFVRMMNVSVRDADQDHLHMMCGYVRDLLTESGIKDFAGPIIPQIDRVKGRYVSVFWVKFPRTAGGQKQKHVFAAGIEKLRASCGSSTDIVLDVDPS